VIFTVHVTDGQKLAVEHEQPMAAIQRWGSILAWIVILSVYGADTIAVDLSLSALIS
jgi:hypothetical protein